MALNIYLKTLLRALFCILLFISGFIVGRDTSTKEVYNFKKEIYVISDTLRTHDRFLRLLAKLESGNNYLIVNRFGYMGKYQIGRQALIEIGFGNVSKEDFILTPELQEIAMMFLLKKNKKFLQSYIGKYNCRTIKGVYITESGLLAGAHAIGYGAVIKWLDSNGQIDPVDGNKIKVSERIKQFSGYNLKL